MLLQNHTTAPKAVRPAVVCHHSIRLNLTKRDIMNTLIPLPIFPFPMTRDKKDVAERVFGLLQAKNTLETEGIATRTISRQIKQRVDELLASNSDEVAAIIYQHLSQNTHGNPTPDAGQERSNITIPDPLKRALTPKRLHLVELLLIAYKNHDFVDHKKLMKAIYNEEHDDDRQPPIKMRSLVHTTKRSIQKWGDIKVIQGKGYRLIVNGIE